MRENQSVRERKRERVSQRERERDEKGGGAPAIYSRGRNTISYTTEKPQ